MDGVIHNGWCVMCNALSTFDSPTIYHMTWRHEDMKTPHGINMESSLINEEDHGTLTIVAMLDLAPDRSVEIY